MTTNRKKLIDQAYALYKQLHKELARWTTSQTKMGPFMVGVPKKEKNT